MKDLKPFPLMLLVVFCAALAVALLATTGCHLAVNAYAIPRMDNIMPEPVEWDEAERRCVMRATTGACQVWAVAPAEIDTGDDPDA